MFCCCDGSRPVGRDAGALEYTSRDFALEELEEHVTTLEAMPAAPASVRETAAEAVAATLLPRDHELLLPTVQEAQASILASEREAVESDGMLGAAGASARATSPILSPFIWSQNALAWPIKEDPLQLPDLDSRAASALEDAAAAALGDEDTVGKMRRALQLHSALRIPLAVREFRSLLDVADAIDNWGKDAGVNHNASSGARLALQSIPALLMLSTRLEFIERISAHLLKPVPADVERFELSGTIFDFSIRLEDSILSAYFSWEIDGALEKHCAIQLEGEIEKSLAETGSISVDLKVHELSEYAPGATVRFVKAKKPWYPKIENVVLTQLVDVFDEHPAALPPGMLRCAATAPTWLMEALDIPLKAASGSFRVVNRGNCMHFEPIAKDRVRVRMSLEADLGMMPTWMVPLNCIKSFVKQNAANQVVQVKKLLAEWDLRGYDKIMMQRAGFYDRIRLRALTHLANTTVLNTAQ